MVATRQPWPALPLAEWHQTRDTLRLWTQIIGKVRMVNAPLLNHWWNVPLYVSATGLTTSLTPHPSGDAFQVDFDLGSHLAARGAKPKNRASIEYIVAKSVH